MNLVKYREEKYENIEVGHLLPPTTSDSAVEG